MLSGNVRITKSAHQARLANRNDRDDVKHHMINDRPFATTRHLNPAEVEERLRKIGAPDHGRLRGWHLHTDGSLMAYFGGGRRFGFCSAAAAGLAVLAHVLGVQRTVGPLMRVLIGLDVLILGVMLRYALRWSISARLTTDAIITSTGCCSKSTIPISSIRSVDTLLDPSSRAWWVDLGLDDSMRRFAFRRTIEAASFFAAVVARRPDLQPNSTSPERADTNVRSMMPARSERRAHVALLTAWAVVGSIMATWALAGSRTPEQPVIEFSVVNAGLSEIMARLPDGERRDATVTVEARACHAEAPLMRATPDSYIVSVRAKETAPSSEESTYLWRGPVIQDIGLQDGVSKVGSNFYLGRPGFEIALPKSDKRWVEVDTGCVKATPGERDQLVESFRRFATRVLATPERA
jgi:hypothetical protein